MAGIKRLSEPPRIELDDDGIAVSFTSGDKIASFSMSWHFFTLALHAAQKLHAEGEEARRDRIIPFRRSGGH